MKITRQTFFLIQFDHKRKCKSSEQEKILSTNQNQKTLDKQNNIHILSKYLQLTIVLHF
jgi:hypothetical protein